MAHDSENRSSRLRGDLRQVRPGETLTHHGPLYVKYRGMHAGRKLVGCLGQGFGVQISRVRCEGDIEELPLELAARHRTVLWSLDGTDILLRFARRCAEQAMWTWPAPKSEAVQTFLDEGEAVANALREWPVPSALDHALREDAPGVERPVITDIRAVNNAFGILSWAELALYGALKAHELMSQHERAASRWTALAFWARVEMSAMLSPESPWNAYADLNDELEAQVWQRAYDLGLTTPDAERDWRIAQL